MYASQNIKRGKKLGFQLSHRHPLLLVFAGRSLSYPISDLARPSFFNFLRVLNQLAIRWCEITIASCEIWSKLTVKTPERRQWRCSGVFIVNFDHILHLVPVFL